MGEIEPCLISSVRRFPRRTTRSAGPSLSRGDGAPRQAGWRRRRQVEREGSASLRRRVRIRWGEEVVRSLLVRGRRTARRRRRGGRGARARRRALAGGSDLYGLGPSRLRDPPESVNGRLRGRRRGLGSAQPRRRGPETSWDRPRRLRPAGRFGWYGTILTWPPCLIGTLGCRKPAVVVTSSPTRSQPCAGLSTRRRERIVSAPSFACP